MTPAEFLPLHAIRASNIAWLLGAGASAAAGIPAAFNMIWDFKRTLYCASHRVSIKQVEDLGDPATRQRIQRFFDAEGGHPAENADDEYAHYFETAYPSEADRRRYLDECMASASPSIGHRALAALVASTKARLIWTTNFDRNVEDAIVSILGSTGKVTVATLDNPDLAMEALNEGRWPLIAKLHGDFQSRRLKNTSDELRVQDAKLRHALIESCRRFGLALVGYSGRDQSVMDALEQAIADGKRFPHGLFWFHRNGAPRLPRVQELIQKAVAAGVEAHIVESETFDELFADLTLLQSDIPAELANSLISQRPYVSNAPLPPPGRGWPVMRTNALPLLSFPQLARRVECSIGGTREVLQAIESVDADVIAGRTQRGVIAFGSDDQVRMAFDPYVITTFDLQPIEPHRLRYESTEFGLLYRALARALMRERPLLLERRGRSYFVRPSDPSTPAVFGQLRQVAQSLTGTLRQSGLSWWEASRLRLDYRLGCLWLLIEPTVLVERRDPYETEARLEAQEFVRERLARRYNPTWNALLEAWIGLLSGGEDSVTVRAFGIGDGVDASFQLSATSGFSRR